MKLSSVVASEGWPFELCDYVWKTLSLSLSFSPAFCLTPASEEKLISVEQAKELREHYEELFQGKFPTGLAR